MNKPLLLSCQGLTKVYREGKLETPVLRGDHVRRHAQMWRISDDFWDEWPQLEAQFTRLENWTPYRGPGSWPDADMLPLGRLADGWNAQFLTGFRCISIRLLNIYLKLKR